jgi:hypothetical protein
MAGCLNGSGCSTRRLHANSLTRDDIRGTLSTMRGPSFSALRKLLGHYLVDKTSLIEKIVSTGVCQWVDLVLWPRHCGKSCMLHMLKYADFCWISTTSLSCFLQVLFLFPGAQSTGPFRWSIYQLQTWDLQKVYGEVCCHFSQLHGLFPHVIWNAWMTCNQALRAETWDGMLFFFCTFANSCQIYLHTGKNTLKTAFHSRKWSIISLSLAKTLLLRSVHPLCINSHICCPEKLGGEWSCSWTSTKGPWAVLQSLDSLNKYVSSSAIVAPHAHSLSTIM